MMNNNWSGYVIDGSKTNIDRLKSSYFYQPYELTAVHAFITRENINELLCKSNFDKDLGILSIDLDGIDYWIFEAITFYEPRILILEYNAVFGNQRKISVPYQGNFFRTKKHYANLYFGASLPALAFLAEKKDMPWLGQIVPEEMLFLLEKIC